jgi:uncharacterized membrane protein (UPF0182 family)
MTKTSSRTSASRINWHKPNLWRAVAIAGVLLLLFASRMLSAWLDSLWFDSLGYRDVLLKVWGVKFLLFAANFAVTYGLLKSSASYFKRRFQDYAPGAFTIPFDGRTYRFSPAHLLPLLWNLVLFLVSLSWAISFCLHWQDWLLFWNQVSLPLRDPNFQQPLNFFLFSWTIQSALASWAIFVSLTICLMSLSWAVMAYLARLPRLAYEPARRTSIILTSLSLALVLVCYAWRCYLARYALSWKTGELFSGIGYLEARVVLPSLVLLTGVLLLGAALAVWNALRARSLKLLIGIVLLPFAAQFMTGIAARYVGQFVIKPNEVKLQESFIQNNIVATQRAFSLDKIESLPFEVGSSAETLSNTTPSTLGNVRLWDWRALQLALIQTQTTKSFYDFPDVDVDRYILNGKLRQVMIAAREIDTEKIPARNWINEKLIYTHGYGVTINTVDEFAADGRPRYVVADMPLRSSAPEIKITRPEIYYGQKTDSHVYVRTKQSEFNFPRSDEQETYSKYEGQSGIRIGGGLRRILVGAALGDLSKLPFSNDISDESRVLLYRQVVERAEKLAPFLLFDSDPYVVVTREGRLVWVLDAYTSSPFYPNSRYYNVGGNWTNYLRSSVKVTVDAYEGTTQFYVFDNEDPIIANWQRIFPKMFQDAAAMPEELQRHIRYPEGFFRVQSEVYGSYHIKDAKSMFYRSNVWSVARVKEANTERPEEVAEPAPPSMPGAMPFPTPAIPAVVERPVEPAFLLLNFPGANQSEFVLTMPFTPAAKPSSLTAWLAGRSDGANYGKLRAYQFSSSEEVAAPHQIRTRIQQEPFLAEKLKLWNQQSSSVLYGSLLTIPLRRGLLYVQPIFLRAGDTAVPQLQLVVLATQERLVYASTYPQALQKLLGNNAPETSVNETRSAANSDPNMASVTSRSVASSSQRQLIQRAAQELEEYQRLTAQGKYGEAGQKLESLRRTLKALQ